MMGFFAIDHPLVQHKLSLLRDTSTGAMEFRRLLSEVSSLLTYEALRGAPVRQRRVRTPIGEAGAFVLRRPVALVALLRAGLGMLEGALRILPDAKVGHVGLYRNPETHQPVEYYHKLPADITERDVLLLDPMLATGGSATRAIRILREAGVAQLALVCLVAAPEGVRAVETADSGVRIFGAALDEGLDEHAYIVPGLGDAGDRQFGTD